MGKQIIISISREYGSGGRVIAEKIAKDLGLPLYDRNLLDEIAREKGLDADNLKAFDEKPRNPFLTRRVRGHSSSMEEAVAEMQFQYLREKADAGESFVVVGRCSEWVLREHRELISIFITGDWEPRIRRIMEVYQLRKAEAIEKTKRHDKHRKIYHNTHCGFRWGHPHGYQLMINSSMLGIDGTAEFLEDYIEKRSAKQPS
ncbi:MAG: cytidylate kinase-like family protein [Blautia sp.]|nr:cytidylate kinase-like family protein [Blautia sp.]